MLGSNNIEHRVEQLPKPSFERVLLIGVGLIGGSLAQALKKQKIASEIIGMASDFSELQCALDLGVIDSAITYSDARGWSAQARDEIDLIIIATPVVAMEVVFCELQALGFSSHVITDVGSTKQSVIAAAELAFGCVPKRFIPGHPIAGKELSGVAHADADLFFKHKVILTPQSTSCRTALEQVTAMWQTLGAFVDCMDAKVHDHILAATSHLPHVLAYALVDSLVATPEETAIFDYAAGGFKSLTRTASSNPIMWRDICLRNADEILLWLMRYQNKLNVLQQLIAKGDGAGLEQIFAQAKQLRDNHLLDAEQSLEKLGNTEHRTN